MPAPDEPCEALNTARSAGSPEEVLRQFVYRPPWAAILAMGVVAPALLGVMVFDLRGQLGEVASLWGKAAVLVAMLIMFPCAVCCARTGWLMLRRRLEGRQRVTLTRDALLVPANVGSREEMAIPYGAIRHLRLDEAVWMKRLCVVGDKQRIALPAGAFPDPDNLTEVVRVLSERTGLPVQPVRFLPRQFSLRAVFILMTVVAMLMSLWICLKNSLQPKVLPLIVTPFVVCSCVLVLMSCVLRTKSRRLFVFVAGFFLGVLVEWAALFLWWKMDWLRLAPNTSVPDNAYPFSALTWRLLGEMRMIDGLSSVQVGLISVAAGLAFCGLIGGFLVLGLWQAMGFLRSRRRRE